VVSVVGLRLRAVGGAGISFGARRAHVVVLQLSRLLRSFVGLEGQTNARACRDGCAPRHAGAQAGLNGCRRASTCQDAISTLRAAAAFAGFALPWRCLGVGIEEMPWVRRTPGLLHGLYRRHRSVSGRAFEMRPVRLLVPDCWIVGVSPE
jgi:hypothetical protein